MGWGMPQTTRLLPIYTLVLPTAFMGVSQYIIIQVARATMLSTFRQREQEMRVRKSIGLLQQINFTQLSCSAFMNMVIKTDLRTLKSVIYCNFFFRVINKTSTWTIFDEAIILNSNNFEKKKI